MSHFSKIKTSITNLRILKKSILDLGLKYINSGEYSLTHCKAGLFVYDHSTTIQDTPFISFEWVNNDYTMVVDLDLWRLDVDFNYFTDRLFPQYGYNIVIDNGSFGGFHKAIESFVEDGSIKVTFKKFC
uniref:Uncharacterized protein ycf35 n=1 Tax=Polysiphonia sertularioides TaxID=945028 RepID=A0A1Z1MGC2_9FLOR|nr:hypothetical protein [Polysiphonia sertularioides]